MGDVWDQGIGGGNVQLSMALGSAHKQVKGVGQRNQLQRVGPASVRTWLKQKHVRVTGIPRRTDTSL